MLYEGHGELEYTAGAQLVSSSPGRDVIEVAADSGIELDIVATDTDDYIRNIRVIMPGGIYADDPYTTVYDPDPGRGDYLPFEREGYVITGFYETNESSHVHTPDDVLANMDPDYVAQIARATVAAALHFAGH